MKAFPKRLIEVDLPIKRISEHARREKSIRQGHISALHIWWARRPLAACRAVICASLWLDPADPVCPQNFRDRAARLINEFARKAVSDKELAAHCSHESWIKWQKLSNSGGLDSTEEAHWNVMRFALLDFIADFSNWDNSAVGEYVETSRAITQAAHEALGGATGTRPLVVDSFAGGGSIPLEALRIGADAYASDLNPIPVLLNKVVLEYIPVYGLTLARTVRESGQRIRKELENRLLKYYFTGSLSERRFGFFWARTVQCEGPACGYKYPLLRSLWIRKKGTGKVAFDLVPNLQSHTVEVSIVENATDAKVRPGTSRQGAATCPVCGFTIPVENVRQQLSPRHGGTDDAELLAVGLFKDGHSGKRYRRPTTDEVGCFRRALADCTQIRTQQKDGLNVVPKEELNHLRGFFNVVLYGMKNWGDLFSPRQALLMTTLTELIKAEFDRMALENLGLAKAVATCLALGAGKVAQYNSSCCRWKSTGETIVDMFGRQAIPMVWDFVETFPFSTSTGDYNQYIDASCAVLEDLPKILTWAGTCEQASATQQLLPNESVDAFITDPPYYDAIPYADLSDFFYVWLRRMLSGAYLEMFKEPLSPKDEECVTLAHRAAMYRQKDRKFFEMMIAKAASVGFRITKPSGIGVVVFANKSTSGWEAVLGGLVDASWTITASWPIDTEMSSRLRAQNSAVLGSSVHLVCRPRGGVSDSFVGDWRDVLAELPIRIHEWMPRLATEGVVGADAIFACIGPALEVFSKYTRVEKASGEQVMLKEYLEYVWAAVAKEALNMIFEGADATGFEEDSRLTAMWLWTLSTGANENGTTSEIDEGDEDLEGSGKKISGFVLEFDAARKIAQGLGAHLEQLNSLVEISGDQARLLPVSERSGHLFGKDEDSAPTKRKGKPKQLSLLDIVGGTDSDEGGWGEKNTSKLGNTVLDRVHQSMILFAAGRGEALKRFLVGEGVGQDQRFWRLAQALSALYPKGTDERRWVEGVLARKKGLGF